MQARANTTIKNDVIKNDNAVPAEILPAVISLFENWDFPSINKLLPKTPEQQSFYFVEQEGLKGSFMAASINGIIYLDSESFGLMNSKTSPELINTVMCELMADLYVD